MANQKDSSVARDLRQDGSNKTHQEERRRERRIAERQQEEANKAWLERIKAGRR